MAASTDLFQEYGLATATTLDSNYTIGDPSFTVASTANWPTATGITFAVDVVDGDGVQVPGSYNEYVGVVSSGTSITGVSHVNGSDRNYSAGATTRVYQAVSKERENRLVEGILEEHKQDGTHSDITADSVTTADLTVSTNLTLPNESVTTADIDDDAITTPKIVDEAVTGEKIDLPTLPYGRIYYSTTSGQVINGSTICTFQELSPDSVGVTKPTNGVLQVDREGTYTVVLSLYGTEVNGTQTALIQMSTDSGSTWIQASTIPINQTGATNRGVNVTTILRLPAGGQVSAIAITSANTRFGSADEARRPYSSSLAIKM